MLTNGGIKALHQWAHRCPDAVLEHAHVAGAAGLLPCLNEFGSRVSVLRRLTSSRAKQLGRCLLSRARVTERW